MTCRPAEMSPSESLTSSHHQLARKGGSDLPEPQGGLTLGSSPSPGHPLSPHRCQSDLGTSRWLALPGACHYAAANSLIDTPLSKSPHPCTQPALRHRLHKPLLPTVTRPDTLGVGPVWGPQLPAPWDRWDHPLYPHNTPPHTHCSGCIHCYEC